MRHIHLNRKYLLAGGFLAFLTVSLVYGCASEKNPPPTTTPTPSAQASASPVKGRAQIWSENCMRCHNMRAPDSYSDGEWEVSMTHMRIRGYLTGQEHKAVEEFLKSAN